MISKENLEDDLFIANLALMVFSPEKATATDYFASEESLNQTKKELLEMFKEAERHSRRLSMEIMRLENRGKEIENGDYIKNILTRISRIYDLCEGKVID